MRGTVMKVNKALLRPILIAGVEKQLMLLNSILCFPLLAATHFQMPQCFFAIGLFVVVHSLLRMLSANDPYMGKIFKRATRSMWRPYFPARSHPQQTSLWVIKTVSRPW